MDEKFMKIALSLAKRGYGKTSPNPLVGAVIVRDGEIVATGYHRGFALPHAEAEALKKAGEKAKGATLYVNLEPCCHHGKTPPCCEAIWKAGIKRVVISIPDPNPLVNGKGIKFLMERGIEVKTGVLARQATYLNRHFLLFHREKRPWITGKMALTSDGAARWKERYLSSPQSLRFAHWLRATHMAIMVGINTVLEDNPLLNVRHPRFAGQKITKVILDTNLRTPPEARLFTTGDPVLIFTSKEGEFPGGRAEVIKVKKEKGHISLKEVMNHLARRGIISVLVEGGPTLLSSMIKQGLVDELFLVHTPAIGGEKRLDFSPVEPVHIRHWCSRQSEHYINFIFRREYGL